MLLDQFIKAGQNFLGCRFPIMCGAMTWISDAQLIGALGNAGGFGLLAGGNAPVDALEKEIIATRKYTVYQDQLRMVCDMACKLVMFAGSIPKDTEIQRVKDAGAKVICFAPTAPLAHRLIKMGADALMIEGAEAGGHIGPVTLSVLLQQILFAIDRVPVFVAGGIATGRMMAHLLLMGAAGIQMGTRFVLSEECKAHPKFKKVFQRANARDAIATPQFDSRLPVIPVRALKNKGSKEFLKLQLELMNKLENKLIDQQQAQFEVENFWVGALREAAIDGNVERGSLMAGQSVGLVKEIKPIQGIIDEMVEDAESELQRLNGIFKGK